VAESAITGHAILAGLVGGCAAAAAAGAVVVAAAHPAGAPAFICLVGTVLLLRSRTYTDVGRQTALTAGGLTCVCACIYIITNTHRESVGPVACALVLVGLLTVRRPRLGATVARLLDRLEYAALAAVVPVACWVGGVYAVVDGFQLR
jgi:hypothetical protein